MDVEVVSHVSPVDSRIVSGEGWEINLSVQLIGIGFARHLAVSVAERMEGSIILVLTSTSRDVFDVMFW